MQGINLDEDSPGWMKNLVEKCGGMLFDGPFYNDGSHTFEVLHISRNEEGWNVALVPTVNTERIYWFYKNAEDDGFYASSYNRAKTVYRSL